MIEHDLTFVAPHRRAEVLDRIRVVKRFIAAPGRAAAELAAAELGLGPTQFYRLARAWREHGRPELLAGSAPPRPLRSLAAAEQTRFVEAAAAELPDAPIEKVAVRAIALGQAAGVAMPALNSVRKILEIGRTGRLGPTSPAFGADVVVTSCAIDLAVKAGDDGPPVQPIVTLVIDAAAPPFAIGASLHLETPDAAAQAQALLECLRDSSWETPSSSSLILAIERREGRGREELGDALRSAGMHVRETGPTSHSIMHDAVALLGRKPAGFRLLPGITNRPVALRRTEAEPARLLTRHDAEELVRSRLVTRERASPMAELPALRRAALAARLAELASG